MCVCVCTCTYTGGGPCFSYTEAIVRYQMSWPISLQTVFLNLEVCWQPEIPRNPPVPAPTILSYWVYVASMPRFSFYVDAGDLILGPHAYTASTLSHWSLQPLAGFYHLHGSAIAITSQVLIRVPEDLPPPRKVLSESEMKGIWLRCQFEKANGWMPCTNIRTPLLVCS